MKTSLSARYALAYLAGTLVLLGTVGASASPAVRAILNYSPVAFPMLYLRDLVGGLDPAKQLLPPPFLQAFIIFLFLANALFWGAVAARAHALCRRSTAATADLSSQPSA